MQVTEEHDYSNDYVKKLIDFMDVDNNNNIQWNEFASALLFFTDMSLETKWVKTAFNIIDSDGKGWLDRSDFQKLTGFPTEYNN